MPKIANFFLRSCGVFFEFLVLAILVFAFLIRSSAFQTFLAKRAAMHFSKEWKTTVKIQKLDIQFFDRLYLEGVKILDQQQRTLLSVPSLVVEVSQLGTERLILDEVVLTNGRLWVCSEKSDGSMNFDFISTYFSSDDTSSSSKPFALTLNRITLNNTSLRYDDYRVSPIPYGFDPNHIDFQNLYASASQLAYSAPKISFHLDRFNLKDRSGVHIKDIKASFSMDSTSLLLTKIQLKLNRSDLRLDQLGYSFDRLSDKSDFLNKASIKCRISPSNIELADVSLFVPQLEGMKGLINIQAEVSNVPNRLKIRNLTLRLRKNTWIKANLELPDFTDWTSRDLREQIVAANINSAELKTFRLPGGKTLNLGKEFQSLENISLKNLTVLSHAGNLKIFPFKVTTAQGNVALNSTIQITPLKEGFSLQNSDLADNLVRIENFNLAGLLGAQEWGIMDGVMSVNSLSFLNGIISMNGGKGRLNSMEFNKYNYRNIDIKNVDIANKVAKLSLGIDDPNLVLDLTGNVNLENIQNLQATLRLEKARLQPLGFVQKPSELSLYCEVSLKGKSPDELAGRLAGSRLDYAEGSTKIEIPTLNIDFTHDKNIDLFKLRSNVADIDFEGKLNFKTLQNDMLYSLSRSIPSWFTANKPNFKEANNRSNAIVIIHEPDQITEMFIPSLRLSRGAKVTFLFDRDKEQLGLDISAKQCVYDSVICNNVRFTQAVMGDSVVANLLIDGLLISDSLSLSDVNFFTNGNKGILRSSLCWDAGRLNESRINWGTSILPNSNYDLIFDESRLSLNGYRWNIKKGSDIQINGETYWANNFRLQSQKNNQEILLKGKLSYRQEDIMTASFKNVLIQDLSGMLGLGIDITGNLGGELEIASPFNNLYFNSRLSMDNLRFSNREFGDLTLGAKYDKALTAVILKGDLLYRDKNTFSFNGVYQVTDNTLEAALSFDNTELAFINGFLDPSVVSNVSGKVNGSVGISGALDQPVLKGSLLLDKTTGDFTLLGCRYTLNGRVSIEENGFFIHKAISLKDSDGNNAALTLAVVHDNFTNFNYKVDIDFEKGFQSNTNPQTLDKFMVLNTTYKEGDYYYGKAYARGFAHIRGEGSSLKVEVDLTSRKGSKVIFPMYGSSELEDASIFHFVSRDNQNKPKASSINYSGIDLKIGFEVTPDADIRLVFNEQTQDEIRAKTSGKLNFSLDAYNQMKLNGSLDILPGSIYNFVMGPARKPFDILEGTVVWQGDAEHAKMNILTSYLVQNANMLELTPDQTNEALARQNTQCLLRLNGDLVAPAISFQLDAPQVPEAGKALLSRINSDMDELNRQFFSLVLFNKFQPLQGSTSANESTALELVESQINSALAQMSKSYQVKMDINASNISTSVQKSFLNDRLIVSGSFGVDNESSSVNGGLIGDVSMEYLINDQGTFRVNAFNRSNGNTVKENAGPFTQGAGLSYHEDFSSRKDFVLLQSFMDIFRRKEKRVVQLTPKKQRTKVPDQVQNPLNKDETHENE